MKGITGFRRRAAKGTKAPGRLSLPAPHLDEPAQDRVVEKVRAMGKRFDAMSEDEFGVWVDALPQEEFIEFMALSIELGDKRQHAEESSKRPDSISGSGRKCR